MLPSWSDEELEQLRVAAIRRFVEQRFAEGAEPYSQTFNECRTSVEDLLDKTNALCNMDPEMLRKYPSLLEALRYACGPPISEDDLKTVSQEWLAMQSEGEKGAPDLLSACVMVLMRRLDRNRFPWVFEKREPTASERHTAVIATATLWCVQRVATNRRGEASDVQQKAVEHVLKSLGYTRVHRRKFIVPLVELEIGQYSLEAQLGQHKADFVIRPDYRHVVAIECKVSNSGINSIKRLNDIINKARSWQQSFGQGVVSVAVLGGVFRLADLKRAQDANVYLVFDHDLGPLRKALERKPRSRK
jgi:hypothetical protein